MNNNVNGQVQNGQIETIEKREKNGSATASKNGRKREENGNVRPIQFGDTHSESIDAVTR